MRRASVASAVCAVQDRTESFYIVFVSKYRT